VVIVITVVVLCIWELKRNAKKEEECRRNEDTKENGKSSTVKTGLVQTI
jgi:hypothetical protein